LAKNLKTLKKQSQYMYISKLVSKTLTKRLSNRSRDTKI
jgi:hypothetical protein